MATLRRYYLRADQEETDYRAAAIQQDLRFCEAMTRAVLKRRERPPRIGVYYDPRPLGAVTPIMPSPYSSGASSPADAMAEAG